MKGSLEKDEPFHIGVITTAVVKTRLNLCASLSLCSHAQRAALDQKFAANQLSQKCSRLNLWMFDLHDALAWFRTLQVASCGIQALQRVMLV